MISGFQTFIFFREKPVIIMHKLSRKPSLTLHPLDLHIVAVIRIPQSSRVHEMTVQWIHDNDLWVISAKMKMTRAQTEKK